MYIQLPGGLAARIQCFHHRSLGIYICVCVYIYIDERFDIFFKVET